MNVRYALFLAVGLAGALAIAQTPPPPPPGAQPAGAPPTAAPAAAPAAKPPAPATAPVTSPATTPAAPATAGPPPLIAVKTDSPCKEDVQAFCAEVQPGTGRLYRCLWEHEGELSVSCRARLIELRTSGGECKDDASHGEGL